MSQRMPYQWKDLLKKILDAAAGQPGVHLRKAAKESEPKKRKSACSAESGENTKAALMKFFKKK